MMPQVQRSGDMINPEKVIASFNVRRNYDYKSDMPAKGSYIEPFGYFSDYTIDEQPGYNVIRMAFSDSATTGSSSASRNDRKAGDVVWSKSFSSFERDIRLHPKYKTYWSYYLASAPGVSQSPSWALERTDNILSVEERLKYKWVSDIDSIPEGWACCVDREKTADNYLAMSGIFTSTTYYSNYDAAEADVIEEVDFSLPPYPKLKDKNIQHYLITNSAAGGDGNLFTLINSWQYWSEGYDTDIYS